MLPIEAVGVTKLSMATIVPQGDDIDGLEIDELGGDNNGCLSKDLRSEQVLSIETAVICLNLPWQHVNYKK